MTKQTRFTIFIVVAALGGVVLNASFLSLRLWPLAILAQSILYGVLFLSIEENKWISALSCFAYGLGFFLPQAFFIKVANGIIPWLTVAVLQAGLLVLIVPVWFWTDRRFADMGYLNVIKFAIAWVAVEELRAALPFVGFPWSKICFSQASSLMGKLVWLGGEPLVSFAVTLSGALVSSAAISYENVGSIFYSRGPWVSRVIVALVIICSGIFVPMSARQLSVAHDQGDLRIAIVQGNVAAPAAGQSANMENAFENHAEETERLLESDFGKNLDLIVWPENSSEYDPREPDNAKIAERLDALSAQASAPILVGVQRYERDDSGNAVARYDEALLWSAGQGVIQDYTKQYSMPFTQSSSWPGLLRHLSSQEDVQTRHGTETGTMTLHVDNPDRDFTIGTLIGFEIVQDNLIHDAVDADAGPLIIQTDNTVFGSTSGSTQQLAIAKLRAIETHRPILQASKGGASAAFRSDGEFIGSISKNSAYNFTVLLQRIDTEKTPAVRAGHWPVWGVWAIVVICIFTNIRAAVRHARRWR